MKRFICCIIFILSSGCSSQVSVADYGTFDPYTYPEQINTEEVTATGNIFYVDPAAGSMVNDGSSDHPWRTLQEVIETGLIETREYKDHPYHEGGELVIKNAGAPVKAGDTIVLRDGFHGKFELTDFFNENYITVMAQDGHQPRVSLIHLRSASRWKISGLVVSPEFEAEYEAHTLVWLETHDWHGPVENITVDSCTAYSVQDTSDWTMDDWNNLSCNGVVADGRNITIRSNYFKNVNFGISVSGISRL